MKQETIQKKPNLTLYFFNKTIDEDFNCPYCGQLNPPMKRGVCICGNQVGLIQFVANPQKFAEIFYNYKVEESYNQALAELLD